MESNKLVKKRIIITRSNPVCPDSRVEKEALTLMDEGYDVTILCWDRDSNHKIEKSFLNLSNKKIPILRIGYKATFGEGIKNLFQYLKFQFSMRHWIKKNHYDFDILHACDFDTAFFTYRLAKRMKKKVVFDIFDFLYCEPIGIVQKIIKKCQLRIINNADLTIICTEERKKQIEGSKPKNLIVVHNSPSTKQLPNNIIFKKRNTEKIRICYVGILQDGRLLKEIGHYFSAHPEYEFHVGGFGYLSDYFKKLSDDNSNIHFYGRIPYEKTLELEFNCDVMLAIYDPKIQNHRYAAPNKFYESLFLGKPVVMVRGTGMSSTVEENNIGELIDYSEEGFSLGVDKLVLKKQHWARISKKMKELYESDYSWEIMKIRLLNAYKNL